MTRAHSDRLGGSAHARTPRGVPPTAQTGRERGQGQRPTKKAVGLRLAPLSAPVWVLVLLVPPEAAETLHEEPWPQEQRQVTIPRAVEPVSAPGGREPGEAQHQPQVWGTWQPQPPRA